jgi:hypothetical protein
MLLRCLILFWVMIMCFPSNGMSFSIFFNYSLTFCHTIYGWKWFLELYPKFVFLVFLVQEGKTLAKMLGVVYLFFLSCLVYILMEGMTVGNYGVGRMWKCILVHIQVFVHKNWRKLWKLNQHMLPPDLRLETRTTLLYVKQGTYRSSVTFGVTSSLSTYSTELY